MPHRFATASRYLYWIAVASCVLLTGCHALTPRQALVKEQFIAPELAKSSDPQIEVGQPNVVLDSIGWVVGIRGKVLLWDRRIDNHDVSSQTLSTVADYLHTNHLPHVKVRANQYAPLADLRRLTQNKTVAWPYRYTLGLLSVAQGAVLPGRIFGGDNFNPYTQTINLYSDSPAVALHEGGHAKDFARRKFQGTYALAYSFAPLWHETIASQDALAYVHHKGDRESVKEANRILYPAYGTYVGSTIANYFPAAGVPLYLGGVIAGHANGRALNRKLDKNPQMTKVAYHSVGSADTAPIDMPASEPSPEISIAGLPEISTVIPASAASSDIKR